MSVWSAIDGPYRCTAEYGPLEDRKQCENAAIVRWHGHKWSTPFPLRSRSRRNHAGPGYEAYACRKHVHPDNLPRLMKWTQVDGDADIGAHGGTLARVDEDGSIELRKIQPVREYIGDREAGGVGFPFWTREAYFGPGEVYTHRDRNGAVSFGGLLEGLEVDRLEDIPELALACALLDYGFADEGPSGWADNVLPSDVDPEVAESLRDEDEDFRREVLLGSGTLGIGEYIGLWADGAYGHEHCRSVLADAISELCGGCEYGLVASLRGPMPDDAWDEDQAIDELNDWLSEHRDDLSAVASFGFLDGSFGLWLDGDE